MKHPNTQALAAAITLAGAVFFGSPVAHGQTTPPAPPATTPPAAPPAPPAATPAAAEPAAPPVSAIHSAPPAAPIQRRVTTPVLAAAGISAVGLGGGIVFGILASSDNAKYKKLPNNDVALSGERNAFISDVAFGVAALFGLTAIALYMLPDEPAPADAAPPPPGAPPPPPAKASVRTWLTAALKGEVLSF